MVLETLAVLAGVKDIFLYNRQSYQFDKTLDQERLYHLQKMRIEQVQLFRDDIRDLFNLVVTKMNNYYLVNTLSLGFSLGFYYEGKIPPNIPSWLYWLWTMSLASAIVYLFLSVWFAVHASVVAQMFSTRLLTQWMRLPVPGPEQIDAAAPKLEEFENTPMKDSLRVPVIGRKLPLSRKQSQTINSSSTPPEGAAPPLLDPATTNDATIQDNYTYYMDHFYMFVRLQRHWMNLDAYCRVCMVMGCNQILFAITYTGLAYFALFDTQWGTLSFCLVPIVFACIHVRMNLILSNREAVVFLLVHSLAPILGSVAAAVQMVYTRHGYFAEGADFAQAVAVGSYLCHLISSGLTTKWGLEIDPALGLPARFTTVNYIDILGLLTGGSEGKKTSSPPRRNSTADLADVSRVVPPASSMREAYQRGSSSKMPVSGQAINNVPDVIATMPRMAFRAVGITVFLLWILGIVFGILSVGGVEWTGWVNVINGTALDAMKAMEAMAHPHKH